MALRKPLFIDADGFPTEMSPGSDSVAFQAITVNGTAGITMVSGTVNGLPTPTSNDQAANKLYVDSVAQGLSPKQAVRVTTSGVDLTAHVGGGSTSYSSSGGAGGTGQFTNAPNPINGVTLAAGNRILVKDQGGVASHVENGIYVATATPTTWDRASDFDADSEALAGSCVFVTEGTVHADTVWCVVTDDPITLNSTAIEWAQFSGAARITAGLGLTKTGDTLDVGGGAGIVSNANDVAVELDTDADAQSAGQDGGSSGLEFDVTGASGQLRVRVDGSGGIQRGASGLLLELDNSPDTLDVDADGLKVVGLPSLFKINDDAVSANVTADNLDELTGGGVTSLHSHAGVSDALRVTNTYTTGGAGVTAGDPVYFSGNATVLKALNTNDTANKVIGVAKTSVGATTSVDIVSDGRLNGVLTGATAGAYVYLDAAGGLTFTRPAGGQARITLIGWAINATDLHVEINFLGRNA
jgi:hypothetical protein